VISRAVPSNIPGQMRDEMIQEVALGIWEGWFKLVNVRDAVRAAMRVVMVSRIIRKALQSPTALFQRLRHVLVRRVGLPFTIP
jgi:hypothetical protein